jgi:ATP-binding cassette subfamily B protein
MPGPMRGKNVAFTKEKINFKAFGKVLLFAKKYFVLLIFSLILSVGGAVLTILGPKQMEKMIGAIEKGILGGMDYSLIAKYAIILISFYVGGAIISYLGHLIMVTITQNTAKKIRKSISEKLNKLPLKFYDSSTKGNIMSVITNDVDTISQALSNSIGNLISGVILLIGSIVMMFITNYLLDLVTIVSSLLGMAIMMIIMVRSQKYFVRNQRQLGTLNGQIEEVYSNHKIVTAYNGQKKEKIEFKKNNKELFASNQKSQFFSGLMQPIMSFFSNLGYVLIFVVGALVISNGSSAITLGIIISFIMYQRQFTQPLSTIAQSMTSLQQASAASVRVNGLLEVPEMEDESNLTNVIENVRGDIEFRNVNFSYIEGKPVINSFSASAKQGQKIAIVGPTGAGKTTLVNLLMKFYEINSGEILIDGIPISTLKRENVHKLFDMILQDTWVFNGTIRENIVFNQENVSDEKIYEVCNEVGLTYFINCLPLGLDTIINEGTSLSEGQKQQITIARAMIDNSPLLILDEATSSLDTMTEIIIQQSMDKLTVGRTSFIIAHRLSTIKNADLILVMKDGDIVESGNHSELLIKNGFYAELYNSQFENI